MTEPQLTAFKQHRVLGFPSRKPTRPAQESVDPDWPLVCRLRRGDMLAFESIVRKYNRRLFLIARGVLHDEDDAEDAVQETYLKVYLKIDQFVGPAGFSAWLARIALNEALQRLRRRSPTVPWPGDDDMAALNAPGFFPLHSEAPYGERHISLKELRGRLTDAIGRLPPGYRTVVLLRGVEGLSVELTAQCLGIPAATVKTRYHRARDRLRREIGGEIESLMPLTFPFAGRRCDRILRLVTLRIRALAYRFRKG